MPFLCCLRRPYSTAFIYHWYFLSLSLATAKHFRVIGLIFARSRKFLFSKTTMPRRAAAMPSRGRHTGLKGEAHAAHSKRPASQARRRLRQVFDEVIYDILAVCCCTFGHHVKALRAFYRMITAIISRVEMISIMILFISALSGKSAFSRYNV